MKDFCVGHIIRTNERVGLDPEGFRYPHNQVVVQILHATLDARHVRLRHSDLLGQLLDSQPTFLADVSDAKRKFHA